MRGTGANGPKRIQLPWMRDVKVGDVLVNASGTYRVVREVTRYADGDLRCITFVIQHCSWTGRPYTVVNFTDLRMQGYRLAHARSKLNGPLDPLIAKVIADHRDRSLTCCMVKGVA